MIKKIKEWSKKHPYLLAIIVSIFVLLLEHMPLHACERSSNEFIKDSIIDGLTAATAFAAGTEMSIAGNFFTGAGLFALGALEAEKAWNEAKQAWDSRDGNSDNGGACGSMGTENNH